MRRTAETVAATNAPGELVAVAYPALSGGFGGFSSLQPAVWQVRRGQVAGDA